MKLNENYYIISDTHFGHKNIMEYEGRPEDYAERIVKNWQKTIGKQDKILFLGDLALYNKEDAQKWCSQLTGEKFMVRGNHDGASETWYKDMGFTVVPPIYKRFKDKHEKYINVLLTHEPVQSLPKDWFNIHGHIHRGLHRDDKTTASHFNASVEVLDYTPIKLHKILDGFRKYKGLL